LADIDESTAGEAGGITRIELDYPVFPRPRSLTSGPGGERLLARLAGSVPAAREILRGIAGLRSPLAAIPARPRPGGGAEPHWLNDWFPPVDAAVLYGLIALRNPRWYVEVGSGHSTTFARRAIRDHGLRTRILSIDPCPRAEVDALCDEVLRQRLEEVDLGSIRPLTDEDLVFVDSSHRALQNSDVTVFFLEVLPALPPGLVLGLHDIFLPQDYPPHWRERLYSEQYLLASYLAGGANGDEILAPLNYLHALTQELAVLTPLFDQLGLSVEQRFGSSFWLRKRAR
jgi:hypothetical protein